MKNLWRTFQNTRLLDASLFKGGGHNPESLLPELQGRAIQRPVARGNGYRRNKIVVPTVNDVSKSVLHTDVPA
jgi:hypothetical protein